MNYEEFKLQLDEARGLGKSLRSAASGTAKEIASQSNSGVAKAIDKVDTGSSTGGAIKGGLSKIAPKVASKMGGLGTALGAGAAIGQAYKNTNRAPAVSGRGAGRATFNNNSTPGAKKDI